MDNQHQHISGYRDLTPEEIAGMNGVKKMEAAFNGLIDHLKGLPGLDQRQVALAATHGEDAFMHAVRAIAQPTRTALAFEPEPAAPAAAQPAEVVVDAGGAGSGIGTGNTELNPVTGAPQPKASETV